MPTMRRSAAIRAGFRSPIPRLLAALSLALLAMLAGCDAPLTVAPPTAEPTATRTRAAAVYAAATRTPVARPTPTVVGQVGRVVAEAVGIDAPLVEVSWRLDEQEGQPLAVWETAEGAAGHHAGTAGPGEAGNCVISGHSGSGDTGEGVFAGLWDLGAGDGVEVIDAEGESHRYRVESVTRVREVGATLEERLANAAVMDPTEDARLTLITCWPEWAYTHRVVVVARPE